MKTKLLAGLGLSACAISFAAKDAIVMTVNGVDVPRSEFEYLYNKNSQQQLSAQPLDEYVEMFKIYKMKVADARAEGLDTTAAFLKEMRQYRSELSAPYLVDSVYVNSLVEEAYSRSRKEAEAYHIMLLKSRDGAENRAQRARLDSIAGVLRAGGDFSELAKKYSQDRSAASNGGYLGYITVNHFPYIFEKTVFELPEGEISGIVESPVGYHILKGGKKRDARGTVLVTHILKLSAADAEASAAAKTKATIDSIYAEVVKDPDSFEDAANRLSDDRGSARQGGRLPWFGAGEMVPEFDSVSFALADGEISRPFRTSYGWHIVKKIDSKEGPTMQEMKPVLITRMNSPQDERHSMIRRHQNERLGKKHHMRLNNSAISAMKVAVESNGLDSLFYSRFLDGKEGEIQLLTIDKRPIAVKEFAGYMGHALQNDPEIALKLFDNYYDSYLNGLLLEEERNWLQANVADYRNLLKEYEDGSLLYEVSVRKVWDKAAKDTEGLEKYFNAHKEDYTWKQPHVKGFLVQVANDSVASLVQTRLEEIGTDSIIRTIRKEFPRVVQIDKVLVEKGQNPMVDNLIFGGPEYVPQNSRFSTFFMFDPRIIGAPEEVNDVRGLVTSDYQTELQNEWEDQLRTKYPVKVNEKILKKVKASAR